MAIDFEKVPRYIRDELENGGEILERGRRGMKVRRVQEWLCYHDCRTGIDGDYGPATAACVETFQRKTGLPGTGIVDAETWQALVLPLRDSLRGPGDLGSLDRPGTVRRIAEQHLKHHPIEIGGGNAGPWVRLYCQGNDGRAWAWCAGFVSMIVHQACFYRDEASPIPGSVSCDTLAAQARAAGRFVDEGEITGGDRAWEELGGCAIFLRRRTSTDWVHAGFALDARGTGEDTVFGTIEGNTNDEGHREGFEACRRTRSLSGDHYDFIELG